MSKFYDALETRPHAEREAALRRALTPEFSAVAHAAQSPYNGGDTSGKICRVLAQFDFAKPKTFYDGPVPEFNPKRSISL